MTTLEVVEAVQRSLENEGFLQLIRAQLRSNVLRIISSGPEYSPQTGKSVELSHRKNGLIVLQLVRQLLEQYDLRQSLAVLEAEAGLDQMERFDRDFFQDEFRIHVREDESVLESLVESVRILQEKTNNVNDKQGFKSQVEVNSITPPIATAKSNDVDDVHCGEDADSASVPEEQSVEDEEEDEEDVNYSQIEDNDAVKPLNKYDGSSANSSPVKVVAMSKDEGGSPLQLEAKHTNSRYSFDAKASPPPPALHPSFHNLGSKQLDASSSFEADSPARSQASHLAQQKFTAPVLEDSFAEESEEDLSVEEDISETGADEDVSKAEGEADLEPVEAASPIRNSDRDVKTTKSRSFSDAEEDGQSQGPEYDSDRSSSHNSHHSAAEAKEERQQRVVVGHKGDSKYSDSDTSIQSKASDSTPSSLRPAVANDFDPTDKSAADDAGQTTTNANRNRIAVRRAALDAAESKSSVDNNMPGAKANVFRLGQSSISRSQLGWGPDTSRHAARSDGEEDDDDVDEDNAATEEGNATARYTSTSQMEAVSFDTDEGEEAHRPSPVRSQPRRSSNQESESEGEGNNDKDHSRDSAHSAADFEAEGDSEGDVSFGDDEDVLPSVGMGVPTARAAFGSPPTKLTTHSATTRKMETNESEDEYGDDFVEDEKEEEDEESPKQAARPVPSTGLFTTRTAAATSTQGRASDGDYGEEEEDEDSVEEEIEEEEVEDMSVGDLGSDDDNGFGSPANAKRNEQKQMLNGDSLLRAGRSGPLPGVSSAAAGGKERTNFDSILKNSDDSESEDEVAARRAGQRGNAKAFSTTGPSKTITDRMREIDSQLEELEQDDPHLADLKNGGNDDNSVASEDIDAMEFSTGGGQDNESESSGEGSFSFLDASTKK